MSERVLISGVTGFVGRPLARALGAAGFEVEGISRDPIRACERVPELRTAHRLEALDGALLSQMSAVVSLAGEPVTGRWTAAKKRRIEESRTEGTRCIVDAIADAEVRPEVLISASGMSIYGDRAEDELTEAEPAGRGFLADVCVEWEREAMRAAELGVRVVRLRIGMVLGPGGGPLATMLRVFRARLGGRIGSGQQWWSWIHVDDLARVVLAAIEDGGLEGVYNAVAPSPVRQAEFARVLGQVLGRPAIVPVPGLALRVVLGELASELLASRRVIPRRLRDAGFGFRHRDLEAALRQVV